MNVLCGEICYVVLLLIGRILLFVPKESFWLIPIHFIFIIKSKKMYKPGTNSSIQWLDICWAGILTLINAIFLDIMLNNISGVSISYLFLCSFISISFYANTIRYKSLL